MWLALGILERTAAPEISALKAARKRGDGFVDEGHLMFDAQQHPGDDAVQAGECVGEVARLVGRRTGLGSATRIIWPPGLALHPTPR